MDVGRPRNAVQTLRESEEDGTAEVNTDDILFESEEARLRSTSGASVSGREGPPAAGVYGVLLLQST